MADLRKLTNEESRQVLSVLKTRFESHMYRHEDVVWGDVEGRLNIYSEKLWSLGEMERTGGEPDVAAEADGTIVFYDFSPESPEGRRKVCYDDPGKKEEQAGTQCSRHGGGDGRGTYG